MNILHLSTSDRIGGAAIAAYRMMEGMNKNGLKSKMLVLTKTTDNPDVIPVENYKFVMKNYSNCVDEAIAALGYPFVEYILKSKPNLMGKIPIVTILNAKYQQNLKNCIDPVVVLLANIFELQEEMQK